MKKTKYRVRSTCQVYGKEIRPGARICTADWRLIATEQKNRRSEGKTEAQVIEFLKETGKL